MATNPVPDGYHTITPYILLKGADAFLEFLKIVFGGETTDCLTRPDGKIAHASIKIGDSNIMFGEACGEWKPVAASLYVYVEDADTIYHKAIEAGATSIMEPADQFYGDRHGGVTDPFGNVWWIATHIEDVSPEDIKARAAAHMEQQKK